MAARNLVGNAEVQHRVVVGVCGSQRATDVARRGAADSRHRVVAGRIGQRDDGRCGQGWPVVGAGDGKSDRGAARRSSVAGLGADEGVG